MPIVNPAHEHATVQPPPVAPVARPFRKFGIELEMVAPAGVPPLARANEVVRAVGIVMQTNSHFGRAYERWQAKPDGSIQPYDRGAEIVSRILPAAASSYDEIRTVVSVLDAAGYGVNRTCGFHVHVNVADLPMHVRQLIVLRYAAMQTEINAMLPQSRRLNSFCQTLPPSRQVELAALIDAGRANFPTMTDSVGRYSVTNIAWTSLTNGDDARIEFRQAAATCNAAKVIGWVSFLQEMIEEVARRASGVQFGPSRMTPPRPAPVLMPRTVGGAVPYMRTGSDNDRALTQLCNFGVVSAQWARDNGIAEAVLRRIIVGWRRHGAGIITQRTDAGPAYILAGVHALPVARSMVFAGTTLPVAAMPAPVAPPAGPTMICVQAASFVAYPFDAGLSDATRAWCNGRREDMEATARA